VGRVTPDCLKPRGLRDLKPRGLRETKKAQTRSALSAAALELVGSRGYEATTVEAIAQLAGVSVRTFHNYFPGKAAALANLAADLVGEYHDELRAQPDDVSCADALRDAWSAMLDRYRDEVTVLAVLVDAVESNPDLRKYLQDHHPEVGVKGVREVARRLGLDPATSVVPHVVTEITFTIAVTVIRIHAAPDFAGRDQDELLDEAFSALPLLVAAPPPGAAGPHTSVPDSDTTD
jgi:AcrR family transcriptional regulator